MAFHDKLNWLHNILLYGYIIIYLIKSLLMFEIALTHFS